MGLQGSPVACGDCGADLAPRHGRIVVTMETGGDLPGYRGRPLAPPGEVKLCASCAGKGMRRDKLGMLDADGIASRQ